MNEKLGEAERQLPFDRESREALPAKPGGEQGAVNEIGEAERQFASGR